MSPTYPTLQIDIPAGGRISAVPCEPSCAYVSVLNTYNQTIEDEVNERSASFVRTSWKWCALEYGDNLECDQVGDVDSY